MIPDSTEKSRGPVTGRLLGWDTPDRSITSRAREVSRSMRIPTSTPYSVSRASTVSSRGVLPARSPIPPTVVWITAAPAAQAIRLLAVPIP